MEYEGLFEAIPELSNKEIKLLDKVDLFLLRKAMKLSLKSSRCLIFLELGILSVEYIIKQKRVQYLDTIRKMEEKSLPQ